MTPEQMKALAETARVEYKGTLAREEEALEHALACGDALLEAQRQIGYGGFGRWLEAEVAEIPMATAQRYMRYAAFREVLKENGITSRGGARKLLQQKGLRRPYATELYDELRTQAMELRDAGEKPIAIANKLGVAPMTVYGWLETPGHRLRREATKKSQAARKRAKRQQAELAALDALGSGVKAAHELLLMMADVVDGLQMDPSPQVQMVAGPPAQALRRAATRLATAAKAEVRVKVSA